mmetsp:Transcript_134586/g.287970  ORF Transcript_134586/g.287970 Transcript_134586/m.287970 type:complete len:909 (+) Transcript_134586:79-2805(+)
MKLSRLWFYVATAVAWSSCGAHASTMAVGRLRRRAFVAAAASGMGGALDNARASSEENGTKSTVQMFNGMLLEAWGRLDQLRAGCDEFQAWRRQRQRQLETSLARLSDEAARQKGARSGAISGTQETKEQFQELRRQRDVEIATHTSRKKADEHEEFLRKDDSTVALFLLHLTKCPEEAQTLALNLSLRSSKQVISKGGPAGHGGAQLCRSTQGFYVRFHDPELKAWLKHVMIRPRARRLLRRILGSGADRFMALQQLDSADSRANNTAENITMPAAIPVKVALVPPERQSRKCGLGGLSCGPLYSSAAFLYGEVKDALMELHVRMAREAREHKVSLQNLNLQMELVHEAEVEFNEQLADSTSKLNIIDEEKQHLLQELIQLRHQARRRQRECTKGIDDIEGTEMCRIRALRGAVANHSGAEATPEELVDCEVSEWQPGECSMKCDDGCRNARSGKPCGGVQKMIREVIQAPSALGAKCPPLKQTVACNQVECPVDCQLSMWSGWSKCSRECNGGIRQRTRSVLREPRNDGEACDAIVETQPCHTDACSRDCVLEAWTPWSGCSAACGGGYQERVRRTLVEAKGDQGKCPSKKSSERYELQKCNSQSCLGDERCIARQDLIIAVDASASQGGEDGFPLLRNFTQAIVAQYNHTAYGGPAARVGVIEFGNGAVLPDGSVSKAREVVALTSDMDVVKAAIQSMTPARGFPNAAQAFSLAQQAYRSHGRLEAESVLLVISSGRPPFSFQTLQKASDLWDQGVRTFTVSVSPFRSGEDAKLLKRLASAPTQANFLHVPGLAALRKQPALWAKRALVAACPRALSPSLAEAQEQSLGFRLLREGKACAGGPSGRTFLGTVASLEECASLAREQEAAFFGFGTGLRRGQCFREDLTCQPQGLSRAFSNIYELLG